MLRSVRWQSLALQVILAAWVLASTDPPLESKEQSDASPQPECQARAWVRAPDMVPGDIIAGDVRIKLSGPCTDAESYALGLRYNENIFWKLRRQDVPFPKRPEFKYNHTDSNRDSLEVQMLFYNPDYIEMEWATYQNSVQNKDLWSLHEEERIAFEIKTPLVGAEGADPLSRSFTSRFGILVPSTNYPPGVEYRDSAWILLPDEPIFSTSFYKYFVEIRFGNGTISEIPAGITDFTPLYLSTQNDALNGNVSLVLRGPDPNSEPAVDVLRSNYTIEVSFPGRVYQDSSVNITATVHRMGYTNRTDTPMQLCIYLNGPNIKWHHQELKNRPHPFAQFIKALVPSVERSASSNPFSPHACRDISFAAAPVDLTGEGHISSSSSEPLSLSVHMRRDAIPDFSTYYFQKLGHDLHLRLCVKPDPSEPLDLEYEKAQWERETARMPDETDFDWVPWLPIIQTRRRYLDGNISLSVIPVQNQRPVRSTPVHYLSDEARQPAFVDVSDIADLRSMSPEERDLLAPPAQPSIKVFAKGEELLNRYFSEDIMMEEESTSTLIYVGDTWASKVLPATVKGPPEEVTVDRSPLVQC